MEGGHHHKAMRSASRAAAGTNRLQELPEVLPFRRDIRRDSISYVGIQRAKSPGPVPDDSDLAS